jgi:hypothetical protein
MRNASLITCVYIQGKHSVLEDTPTKPSHKYNQCIPEIKDTVYFWVQSEVNIDPVVSVSSMVIAF